MDNPLPNGMNDQEQRGILSICILAAQADGSQSDVERTQIERIAEALHPHNPELAAAYEGVLTGKAKLAEIVNTLQSPESKRLAYEVAVCVCHADGIASESERQFLTELRQALQLSEESTAAVDTQAHAIAKVEPMAVPPRLTDSTAPIQPPASLNANLDQSILNYSILTGALELLPHSLATMAIVPLQIKMVYEIGRQHGLELSRGHITDFLTTVGVGLTSQVVEGFARRFVGNLARHMAGRLVGGLAGQAAGSAVAFGTTYALGQVAKRYYASNRTLTGAQLKEAFATMLNEGNSLQSRYTSDILQNSRQINVTQLLPLLK
jgi:uncharacterized protein (DUF697 family)/tellurite resistance protein